MGLSVLRPSLSLIPSPLRSRPRSFPLYRRRSEPAVRICKIAVPEAASPSPAPGGAEEALFGFIAGKKRATEVAHSVWRNVLRKGDCAIDATCGNGHDTLALLRMVADESGSGFIYGFDIQSSAIESTRCLLEDSLDPDQRRLVKLSLLCHSKMEEVLPEGTMVRLVAFNLGYLPGGGKDIITLPGTTLPALHAASRVLAPGGLISVLVYVGHPGGREELETVQSFASSLPAESWSCCKLERLNRPSAPLLLLLLKK